MKRSMSENKFMWEAERFLLLSTYIRFVLGKILEDRGSGWRTLLSHVVGHGQYGDILSNINVSGQFFHNSL